MKIVAINSYNFGSTGNIMHSIAAKAREKGIVYYTACPSSRSQRKSNIDNHIYIGNRVARNMHIFIAKIFGTHGSHSVLSTFLFLNKIKKINPNVIHLHNIHGDYININMLFNYIKKNNIPVVWTLHDCWAFTGLCPHFVIKNCEKWKTGCHDCPSLTEYPKSIIDNTKIMWKLKKRWFTNVNNLTIVTPSNWLCNLVQESYLKNYRIKVIHSGIDLTVFQATEGNFRIKYNISNSKKIILGVAFGWNEKKGLDIFIELSKRLNHHEYQIVLVGTNSQIDLLLPDNIISIHRTQNQCELAEIYTAADVFVNPTREEVLGLVNIESLACGTPVITFRTGGSPECIDTTCGVSIECDDIESLEHEILRVCTENPFSKDMCVKKAKKFDRQSKYKEYIELYEKLS